MITELATFLLSNIPAIILFLLVFSIPLYLAVFALGGKTSFWRFILANIGIDMATIFVAALGLAFSIIPILATIFLYKKIFRLTYLKAAIVWVLKYVILFSILLVLSLVGII